MPLYLAKISFFLTFGEIKEREREREKREIERKERKKKEEKRKKALCKWQIYRNPFACIIFDHLRAPAF